MISIIPAGSLKKKKKIFPADSFLLLDRCSLNVMKEMCLTRFTMVSCPPPFLFCLSYVLHSLLSFSLDDVRKLQRTRDPLFFLLGDKALPSAFEITEMTMYLSHCCEAYWDILNMKGAV